MTDKRTHRRVKTADTDDAKASKQEDNNEPSKQQYQVAKYLRWQCPTKQTPMEGRGSVVYFTAAKAVETLLASKWATNKGGREPLFVNRESAVRYLDELLKRDFFHRAKKITVKRIGGRDETATAGVGSQLSETESSPRASPRAAKGKKAGLPAGQTPDESSSQAARRKKIKLEWHPAQRFVDGKEAYVWLYEPTSISQIVYGSLIVLGAIGLCLFPLWPPIVRQGVYYLALTAASLIGFLFFLAAFRYVPFAMAWAVTFGKLHFWLLPNLTQDVGFLESFMPVYDYEWQGKAGDKKKDDDAGKDNAGASDGGSEGSDGKKSKQNKKSENNKSRDAGGTVADTETEEDDEATETVGDEQVVDESEAVDPDRETLRGRSASPSQDISQHRTPSSSPTAKFRVATKDEPTSISANDADVADSKDGRDAEHDSVTSSSRVASGSSQDSSSQEEFEMIEREDKLHAAQ